MNAPVGGPRRRPPLRHDTTVRWASDVTGLRVLGVTASRPLLLASNDLHRRIGAAVVLGAQVRRSIEVGIVADQFDRDERIPATDLANHAAIRVDNREFEKRTDEKELDDLIQRSRWRYRFDRRGP